MSFLVRIGLSMPGGLVSTSRRVGTRPALSQLLLLRRFAEQVVGSQAGSVGMRGLGGDTDLVEENPDRIERERKSVGPPLSFVLSVRMRVIA